MWKGSILTQKLDLTVQSPDPMFIYKTYAEKYEFPQHVPARNILPAG